jgi:Heavy-metal-associated domain
MRRAARRTTALCALLGALGGAPAAARSEVLEVRQIAGGMECVECARNLRIEVSRLPGVEAASTSFNRRVLTVRFARGNRSTLADVRAILRRQHFVPGEAEIVVAGRVRPDAAGQLILDVGAGASFRLDLGGRSPAVPAGDGEVVITGRVAGEGATPAASVPGPASLAVLTMSRPPLTAPPPLPRS